MDPIKARERLADTMIDHIRTQGYFLVDVDPGLPQCLVDLRWAALVAGRHLGCDAEVYVSEVGKAVPAKVTALVAPATWRAVPFGFDTGVRSIVEDLLHLRVGDRDVCLSA